VHTLDELRQKLAHRRDEWRRLGVSVNGAALLEEIMADLDAIAVATTDAISLREAHLIGGYSVDHLQRLVRSGKLANVGRKNRPRLRRADVPIKPGFVAAEPLRSQSVGAEFDARRRIVASVLTGETS
jgi:hypothetical protein